MYRAEININGQIYTDNFEKSFILKLYKMGAGIKLYLSSGPVELNNEIVKKYLNS